VNSQFLVIIRGAPASGKTTIAKRLRNFEGRVAWLKVDNFKDFFSDDALSEEQKYVDEAAVKTLEYLLDSGFSVVMEKIFYDPHIISVAMKVAVERNIKCKVFQIKCSLQTLLERDKSRPGIKEGCRKPLGEKLIKDLFTQLENTFYQVAIPLDTEKLSIDDCIDTIRQEIED